jgi:hypothetical protein
LKDIFKIEKFFDKIDNPTYKLKSQMSAKLFLEIGHVTEAVLIATNTRRQSFNFFYNFLEQFNWSGATQ